MKARWVLLKPKYKLMKVLVKMSVSMAGPTMYKAGGEYEFPENEAKRLEQHGKCVILSGKPETPTVKTAHIGPSNSPNQPQKKRKGKK